MSEHVLAGLVGLVVGYLAVVLVAGRRWLAAWHGEGTEAHQHQFFRCLGCRRLVTWRHIQTGGCVCRESFKVSPAVLSRAEKARALWLPFTVTSWATRRAALRTLATHAARRAARAAR